LASQGEPEKALERIRKATGEQPENPDLWAKLGDLQFTRGDWEGAAAAVQCARKTDADHLSARWVEARLLEGKGERNKAVAACKWFVDRYNDRQGEISKNAEALLIVGQAAERYYRAKARGDELSDSLNDVINQIYETALKADSHCWQAPWLEGRL